MIKIVKKTKGKRSITITGTCMNDLSTTYLFFVSLRATYNTIPGNAPSTLVYLHLKDLIKRALKKIASDPVGKWSFPLTTFDLLSLKEYYTRFGTASLLDWEAPIMDELMMEAGTIIPSLMR